MTLFDKEWNRIATKIIMEGTMQEEEHVRARWEDGTKAPAKFITSEKMSIDTSEPPLPGNKFINIQQPLHELDWIWVDKSNKVSDLRAKGSHIWDKWEIKQGKWAGTIGPAYGYQLNVPCRLMDVSIIHWDAIDPKKLESLIGQVDHGARFVLLDQVDYLIQSLLINPGSRRHIVSLWNINDLDEMALEPCVWKTRWVYNNGKLDLIVGVRSNDFCVGNPFNVFQYYVLQRKICQATNLEPGKLDFDLDEPHIYDRHMDEALKQILYTGAHTKPSFWMNPLIKNFYEFNNSNDIRIDNYVSGPKRTFEVAE